MGKGSKSAPQQGRSLGDLPVIETHHTEGGLSLHYRFMGLHAGRAYIVNVQFSADDEQTAKVLTAAEQARYVAELMQLLGAYATVTALSAD